MSVSIDTPMYLAIDVISRKDGRGVEGTSFFYLAKPRAMISKMPGNFRSFNDQTNETKVCMCVV